MIRALLVILALPVIAFADAKSDAVALFNEGLKEMKAGNYEKACTAFRESNRLYPDSGTQGSLARCYDKQGRIASSWKLWTELAKTAPEKLRPDAAANAAKLEPRLPKYVIRIPKGAPQIQATIDGVVVDATPDVPTPIDPGKYVFEANAANYGGWKHELEAVEGKTVEIKVDMRPVAQKPDPEPVKLEEPRQETPKSSKRKIGIALMGVGGAFVIGGSVFGVIAKGRNDDAKDICGGDIDACNPSRLSEAQDKVDSARTAGNISTVGFIVGGAAIVTGVVLFVTAPKAKTQVALTPTGVLLTRSF